ncbi:hypothetical protein H6F71_02900 [Microcoleus sp. FACHB-61]|nr:hypothetical protein [Microcoleus sp. FACHB-61]
MSSPKSAKSCLAIREGRRKREDGRRKKEEGRRKKEEGRGKTEEGRRKREEGRGKREDLFHCLPLPLSLSLSPSPPLSHSPPLLMGWVLDKQLLVARSEFVFLKDRGGKCSYDPAKKFGPLASRR